eukprot:595416-Pyramimonas_sp.AAC.2
MQALTLAKEQGDKDEEAEDYDKHDGVLEEDSEAREEEHERDEESAAEPGNTAATVPVAGNETRARDPRYPRVRFSSDERLC